MGKKDAHTRRRKREVKKSGAGANHQRGAHRVCLSVLVHVSVLRVFVSPLSGRGRGGGRRRHARLLIREHC